MGDLLAQPNLARLGSLLWEYRAAFDRLHFLLETQLLLIGSGRDDQLHHLVDLLDEANARIHRLDLEREILIDVGPDGARPHLSQLADRVEAPWDEILREHQRAMEALVARTDDLVRRNGALIRRVRSELPDLETLLSVGTAAPAGTGRAATSTYGRSGRDESASGGQAYLFEDRI